MALATGNRGVDQERMRLVWVEETLIAQSQSTYTGVDETLQLVRTKADLVGGPYLSELVALLKQQVDQMRRVRVGPRKADTWRNPEAHS